MIRKYKISDKEELISIFKLNTPKYFDKSEILDFENYLDSNGENYYTIEVENKIVGGTGIEFTDKNTVGRITWIFFHPEETGQGLGKLSLEHCLTIFRKDPNIKKVLVTTSQLAYKFFQKFDFIHINSEKDYWGKGLDLYLMELKINE